ncbi:hypothetical protein BDV59DRAFT_67028 [Aspergillus ambiguus]|uniref:uncharacterized protein n=1 Tax=Aspergillus ambiguus TaxID=176160 RepID=UPI003CCE4A3B
MEEVEEVTLRIENAPRAGGLGYLVLSGAELKELGDALLPYANTIRSLYPLQLVDLLRRLYGVNGIKSWSLSKAGQLIASSHAEAEANTTHAATSVDGTVGRGQLTSHADILPRNVPQSTGIDITVDIQNDKVAPGQKEAGHGGGLVHGTSSIPAVAQTPRLASEGPLSHASSRHYLTPPVDSPRKRQRRASTASTLPSPADQLVTEQTPREMSQTQDHEDQLFPIPDNAADLLRKACKVKKGAQWLSESDVGKVLRLSAQLIDPDPRKVLRPMLRYWDTKVFQGFHPLGLPREWIGVEAAATYNTMLSTNRIGDPVGQLVARMLLVLNYEVICARPETYCPRSRQSKEKRASYVVSCIMHACYARPPTKKERDEMHNYFRQGRLLWTIASIVGLGIVLIRSDKMVSEITNVSITWNRIQALAAYTLYTRPAMVALLRSLESAVADLMFGNISRGLSEAIRDEAGILGQSAMSRMNEADRLDLICQYNAGSWEPIDFGLEVYQLKTRLCPNIQITHRAGHNNPEDTSATPLSQPQPDDEAAVAPWMSATDEEALANSQFGHGPNDIPLTASPNQCQQKGDAAAAPWMSAIDEEVLANSQFGHGPNDIPLTASLNQCQQNGDAAAAPWMSAIDEEVLANSQFGHGPNDFRLTASLNQCQQDGDASTVQWTPTMEDEIMANSQNDLNALEDMLNFPIDNFAMDKPGFNLP